MKARLRKKLLVRAAMARKVDRGRWERACAWVERRPRWWPRYPPGLRRFDYGCRRPPPRLRAWRRPAPGAA